MHKWQLRRKCNVYTPRLHLRSHLIYFWSAEIWSFASHNCNWFGRLCLLIMAPLCSSFCSVGKNSLLKKSKRTKLLAYYSGMRAGFIMTWQDLDIQKFHNWISALLNLINAYRDFIFKYEVSHIMIDFYLPLGFRKDIKTGLAYICCLVKIKKYHRRWR